MARNLIVAVRRSRPTFRAASPLAAQSYRLNDPLAHVPRGSVLSFQLAPDGTRAVVLMQFMPLAARDLVRVAVDGASASVQLEGGVPGTLSSPSITADSEHVVFLSTTSATRLFGVPLDGGQGDNRQDR